jgi:hypothetical protein
MQLVTVAVLLWQIWPDHARIAEAEREKVQRTMLQQQVFEQRFNALVAAVEAFAKEYNRSKGAVWPRKHADELRLTMQRVQETEPGLRLCVSK